MMHKQVVNKMGCVQLMTFSKIIKGRHSLQKLGNRKVFGQYSSSRMCIAIGYNFSDNKEFIRFKKMAWTITH
jgi:hypothetical protein